MKKSIKLLLSALLCLSMLICMIGCNADKNADSSSEIPNLDSKAISSIDEIEKTGVWADAEYTTDTTLGEGTKVVQVEVSAEDKSITFTLNTDKENLGDALMEHKLLEGEESEYGLYIKKVIGIRADYDLDGAYWAISKDGEYLMTGVDTTIIADGEHYELTYTKG